MALTVRSPSSVFALARATFFGSNAPDLWLVGLRWIAIAGMVVTVLVGKALVPGLALGRVLVAVGAVALLNVVWSLLLRRRAHRIASPGATVGYQIAFDLVALTVVLWLSGGLTNPFAVFLTFQIVLAGILGTRRTTVAATVLTIAAAVLLCFAPPLPIESAAAGRGTVEFLARAVSMLALSGFIGVFVFVFADRLERLREVSSRSEKLAGLGRTVAAICHELNTPLGTILLAGKDVEKIGEELGADEVRQLGRTVADDARRAADVIGLMRGYVSPSERKELVDLGSFVSRHVDQELDRLGFEGQRVIEVDARGPVQLVVLRAAVSQILTNLLKNAVEAMAIHETPSPRIEVRIADDDEQVDVTITDNGPGISPELIDRLGEPFQTTKQGRGGTGLGLYVSSLLADRTGGALQLESQPGRGARVTLSLRRRSTLADAV